MSACMSRSPTTAKWKISRSNGVWKEPLILWLWRLSTTDNLQNVKLIASHHVGIIRSDVADSLVLKATHSFRRLCPIFKMDSSLVEAMSCWLWLCRIFLHYGLVFHTMPATSLLKHPAGICCQCGKKSHHIKSTNGSNTSNCLNLFKCITTLDRFDSASWQQWSQCANWWRQLL